MRGVALKKDLAFTSQTFRALCREIRLGADYSKLSFSLWNSESLLACCQAVHSPFEVALNSER